MTGGPVMDAAVVLIDAGLESRSDEEGRFSFDVDDIAADTLLVTHGEYRTARFVLSHLGDAPLDLHIDLRPGPVALSSEITTEARELLAVLDARGARSWSFHQFDPFIGSVSHPLELLLYSGLVAAVDVTPPSGGRCVVIRLGGECAAVRENEREANSVIVSALFPWEVATFRVVPPDMDVPELDLVAGEHPGLVVVFTAEEERNEEGPR